MPNIISIAKLLVSILSKGFLYPNHVANSHENKIVGAFLFITAILMLVITIIEAKSIIQKVIPDEANIKIVQPYPVSTEKLPSPQASSAYSKYLESQFIEIARSQLNNLKEKYLTFEANKTLVLPTTTIQKYSAITIETLKNLTYQIDNEKITLNNGEREFNPDTNNIEKQISVLLTDHAFGDWNSDGNVDAIAILQVSSGGGNGIYYYLAAIYNNMGIPVVIEPTYALGDRLQFRNIAIAKGSVDIELMMHGSNDGLCCPTVFRHLQFSIIDNTLQCKTEPCSEILSDPYELKQKATDTPIHNTYKSDITEVTPIVTTLSNDTAIPVENISKTRQARKLNQEGIKASQKGDIHGSLALFKEAVQLAPNDAEILGNFAFALFQIGDLAGAEKATLNALKIRPKRGSCWILLGHISSLNADLQGATKALINYLNFSKNKKVAVSKITEWSDGLTDASNNLALKEASLQALEETGYID